jgi:hypothetical protein
MLSILVFELHAGIWERGSVLAKTAETGGEESNG